MKTAKTMYLFFFQEDKDFCSEYIFFFIEFIRVKWVNKIIYCRFQVYNSIIHNLYIVLCVHHAKSSLLPSERLSLISQQRASAGKDTEETEPLCTVGGNANWCSHCGKEYGISSKKNITTFHHHLICKCFHF